MADVIDIAQERAETELIRAIAAARTSAESSLSVCEECDAPIPEARRRASPGVTRCIDCQQQYEAAARHYRK